MVLSPRARHRMQKPQNNLGNGQPVGNIPSPPQRARIRTNATSGAVSQQVRRHRFFMTLGMLCLSSPTFADKMHASSCKDFSSFSNADMIAEVASTIAYVCTAQNSGNRSSRVNQLQAWHPSKFECSKFLPCIQSKAARQAIKPTIRVDA